MSNKIQQSYIYKFNTDRLKNSNYNVTIDLQQARKNGELISIGESQMLKSLRKITHNELDKDQLTKLFAEKKKVKNRSANPENVALLSEIKDKIDKILFVPEIISVVIKNVKYHYPYIIKNGLFINNKLFVRLMCSAGQARRNNVLMIQKDYEAPLKEILNNDRTELEIAPAKFNAYFALSSSTSLEVETPYFCVIPDLKIKRTELVDFVLDNDGIETCEKELEFNVFDGQGIVSPRQAKIWADNLGLDYLPSAFIVRGNFIKGLVVVIDFLEFSDKIGKHFIDDIYGNQVNIRDMDVILTESQFKLREGFGSIKEYTEKCKKNELGWWISRYSPEEENKFTSLNYQFLQVLNLDNQMIESICSQTLEYFENTISNDIVYTLLYLLGHKSHNGFDENILEKIEDAVTKSLILNNDLLYDPYIQNHILNSLKKKIKDSYLGKLIIDGFYTFMVSDPYAFLEHLFGLPIKGLLNRGEHFNDTWMKNGANQVAAMRSPLTWRSEVEILNLVSNDEIKHWYQYLKSCVVFNVHGCDMALLGGADFDGDIVCLTNNKDVINGSYGGLPVFYETKSAPKEKIKEEELYLADIKGFNSKVGFLTNCSTTMYAMLPLYEENSDEYKELIGRLKQSRKEQGALIDATKGLIIKPIPKHWTNWTKIEDDMSDEDREIANFNNSILVDKRPLFMQFLYPNYRKSFLDYKYNYNLYCIANFGLELDELIKIPKKDLSLEQSNFIKQYNKFIPLLDTDCTINKISLYMQEKTSDIIKNAKKQISRETDKILKNKEIPIDEEKLQKLIILYKKYKQGKRNLVEVESDHGEGRYKTLESYNKAIRREAYNISPDIRELACLAVEICYNIYPSDNKSFAWGVFGDGVVENVKTNRQKNIEIPFLAENGNILYLGHRYYMAPIHVEDEDYDFL